MYIGKDNISLYLTYLYLEKKKKKRAKENERRREYPIFNGYTSKTLQARERKAQKKNSMWDGKWVGGPTHREESHYTYLYEERRVWMVAIKILRIVQDHVMWVAKPKCKCKENNFFTSTSTWGLMLPVPINRVIKLHCLLP